MSGDLSRPALLLGIVILISLGTANSLSARKSRKWTAYERQVLRTALKLRDTAPHPAPEGKRIRKIHIVTLEVYTRRDLFPKWLNYFHATTKPYVIKRELVFREGQVFDWQRIRESARNLRGVRQNAVVVIVPVINRDPNSIDILVITKDLWSIRLNSDFRVADGNLIYLFLQPTEENLAGTQQAVGANFLLRQDTISFGPQYTNRRLGLSRWGLGADFNVVINRQSRKFEGANGSLSVTRPLFSVRDKWGISFSANFNIATSRSYVGSRLRTYDDPDTPDDDLIPFTYRRRTSKGSVWLTRSFGLTVKHNFSIGLAYLVSRYIVPDGVPLASRSNYRRDLMPVDETLYYPAFEYHTYRSKYQRMTNVVTMGLTEDFQVGHNISFNMFWPSRLWGLDRNFLGVSGNLRWTWAFNDYLLRVQVNGSAELEATRVANIEVSAAMLNVSPVLLFGRLIWEVSWTSRFNNDRNVRTSLGGDGRLRGFTNGAFFGRHVLISNLEFRSLSVRFFTLHFGFAIFYDVGDAFDEYRKMRLKHGVGIGLRILIPQWDRAVLRIDWGVPVYGAAQIMPGKFVFTLRQAF